MTIKEIYEKKKSTYLYFSEIESLEAVEKDGYALQFVANQNEEICLRAVEENGYALRFVRIPRHKMTIQEIESIVGYEIELIY